MAGYTTGAGLPSDLAQERSLAFCRGRDTIRWNQSREEGF
jgi:hypothetical protein